MIHYFDNAATTPLSPAAKAAVKEYMDKDEFGNPSALYSLGIDARKVLTDARESLAAFIKCDPDEIYFTGCGTESNNTALFGAARALCKRGKRIITSEIEHHSVLNPLSELEKQGFEVIKVKPRGGNIAADDVIPYINDDTVLASFMLCNNETGAILPVSEIANALKRKVPHAIMHVDAVGALGKIPINTYSLSADIMSFSAHKLFSPKGLGALYIRKGARILPLLYGGGQEKNMRSGTENTLAIKAFSASLKDFSANLTKYSEKVSDVRDIILNSLPKGAVINSPEGSACNIINLSYIGCPSEVMLHLLESKNVFVSAGSACSSKSKGSHVLTAMGKSPDIIKSALRISISPFNSEDDAVALCKALEFAINSLKGR